MSRRAAAAALAAALAGSARAAALRIPITADTSICAHESERGFNAGRVPRLKLKGIENLILLDFDPAPIAGKVVTKATLRLKPAGRTMIRWIGVSAVSAGWDEGSATVYGGPGGGATFRNPGVGRSGRWAGPDGAFLDTVFGRGGAIWTRGQARAASDGWLEVTVDGRLLEARAAGLSFGLALSDDSGQTMRVAREVDPAANFSNNFVFSRERAGAGPVLVVEAAAAPPVSATELAVAVVPWPGGASGTGGGIEVSWDGPATPVEAGRIVGYRARIELPGRPGVTLPRWLLPAVPPPGERARVLLAGAPPEAMAVAQVEIIGRGGTVLARGTGGGQVSGRLDVPPPLRLPPSARPPAISRTAPAVWAAPEGARIHPVTGTAAEETGTVSWRNANAVWDGTSRTIRLGAIRGEWVGFQLVLEGPGEWRVEPGGLGRIPAAAVRLSRVGYVRPDEAAEAWIADPLVPLGAGEPVRVPADPRALPGQTNQAVYVELLVPEDAKPGRHGGRIEVRRDGKPAGKLSVRLEVSPATMPREAHFTWSLNTYASPGAETERAWYALAHDHRATLAVLHYSHSGTYEEGCVPAVGGEGAAARVADWTAWDRRFGPLFDGSAFAGTSRPGVPLDHFYLALCEHYPVPMAKGYRWNRLKWEDHWKRAGPIEEGFTPEARAAWVAVARDYLEHIRAKGWRTSFQVYLNDKYFYKMYDPDRRAWGKGASFWLLDEPQHADDYLALKYFGGLVREAQGGDRSGLVFRVDVSRPEWGRDLLDRVVDLNVTGGFPASRRLLADWRERHGQRVWTYGDSPGAGDSPAALSVRALELWAAGIDGYVPWQVVGGDANWRTFASTSVIYPGGPAGVAGPCASLRLKAFRRAEQDVEYAWAYAAKRGWHRDDPQRRRIAALLSSLLPTGHDAALDSEGAVFRSHGLVAPALLDALRSELRRGL